MADDKPNPLLAICPKCQAAVAPCGDTMTQDGPAKDYRCGNCGEWWCVPVRRS